MVQKHRLLVIPRWTSTKKAILSSTIVNSAHVKDSPQTPLNNDTTLAEQVLVLPGSVFFIDHIEVPIELEAAEISDYIELSLESH